MPRQDFLLQPYIYPGSSETVWDFPLDDFYIGGVIQPTPYGNSDNQHIIDIIVNNVGAIKQFPLLGFGLFRWLNSEAQTDVVYSSLTSNMKMDGYLVGIGTVKPAQNNGFEIDTGYIKPNY